MKQAFCEMQHALLYSKCFQNADWEDINLRDVSDPVQSDSFMQLSMSFKFILLVDKTAFYHGSLDFPNAVPWTAMAVSKYASVHFCLEINASELMGAHFWINMHNLWLYLFVFNYL